MKRNPKTIIVPIFILSLILSNSLEGQNTVPPNDGTMEAYISMGDDVQMINTFDFRYEGVKGTPYLYEDWQKGYVNFKNKKEEEAKTFKMNINLYEHTLFVVLYNGTVGTLPSQHIEDVNFIIEENGEATERKFIPLPRKQVEGLKVPGLGFYQIVHKGEYLLLKNYRKIFQEADYKGAYSTDVRYDEYKDEKKYFFSKDGTTFEKLKLKSKNLEKALPKHASDIKKTIKEKKLNLSNDEDVKTLLITLENKS